jgi:zinc transport system substrate-binding protein
MKTHALVFGILTLLCSTALTAAPPVMVVTLKPLHSLVSGLVAGISQPALLLQGTQSPHDYQLKPSERRVLDSADVIIYASDSVESFIPSLRRSLGQKKVIELARIPGLNALPARASHEHSAHEADLDGHIWLSTANARVMVEYLGSWLIQHDAANKAAYLANRDRLLKKIDALELHLKQQLEPVRNRPFLQFHDALQYFETEFGLEQGLYATTGAEHSPGARHVQSLQQQVRSKDIQCFFYEPPQAPKILLTLDVSGQARKYPLDIHGSQLQPGEQLYFDLLEQIGNQMQHCLTGK